MNGEVPPVSRPELAERLDRPDRRGATRARQRSRQRSESLLDFGGAESLPHLAGLDGLRGIAVGAVVVFHGGFDLLPGGYLGVSLFFTLSGFLITSLLVAELDRHGSVDLRAFWSRRFRRLLPAAWLTLIVVGVVAVSLNDVAPGLRGDLWASAANVANWRFQVAGTSYADLFSNSSPVLHFWSLAIEEQFYLLFPVLFAGLWRICRARRPLVATVLMVASTASFTLPVINGWTVDRTYYGTDTRAGELLIGAALALAVNNATLRRLLVRRWWWRTAAGAAGCAAMALAVAMWVTLEEGDPRLRAGALPVVAMTSCVLILASVIPSGPMHRLTLIRPLRWLGRVSYGIYLFHWPVLVWTGANRTGPDHALRFILAMIAVGALAQLSLRLIETPIRRGGDLLLPMRALAGVASLALLVGPIGLTGRVDAAQEVVAGLDDAAESFSDPAATGDDTARVLGAVEEREPGPVVSQTAPPRDGSQLSTNPIAPPPAIAQPPVVSFFGDSIALSLAMTVGYRNNTTGELVDGRGVAVLGCGVIPGGSFRFDRVRQMPKKCDNWADQWSFVVRAATTDVAVVQSCQWETVDRRFPGSDVFVAPGDRRADDIITLGYLAAVDVLIGAGADLVVWVRCPYFSQVNGVRRLEQGLRDSRDPARTDRLNAIIAEVAAQRPGTVEVMPWDDVVNARVDDASWRPDGSHYQWKSDVGIAQVFVPQLRELIDQARTKGP